MPVITDILQQQKDATRYSIYIDGEFAFGVTGRALVELGIYRGQELTVTELEVLQNKTTQAAYFDQVLNYISYRRRTRREIADYLDKKGAQSDGIEATIERLTQLGLVSDSEFAASWIRDRSQLKPRSRRHLAAELRGKGLSQASIDQALGGYSAEDEMAALKSVITKKLARYSDQSQLIQYLLRQGYPYSLIKTALAELGPASGDETIS